jgi:hypothetical protein
MRPLDTGGSFLKVERPGRGAPSSAKVKNVGAISLHLLSYVIEAWCLVNHRDNLPLLQCFLLFRAYGAIDVVIT